MKMSRSRWWLVFGGIVWLYVLSVGPAYRMAARNVIAHSWFATVYGPVILVGDSVPLVDGAFDWYLRLWHDSSEPVG